MRIILICQHDYTGPAAVHSRLASSLGFPAYYGANLDALNDCLGDVAEPVCIVLVATHTPDEAYNEWFAKLVRVMHRAARENENLNLRVRGNWGEDLCETS